MAKELPLIQVSEDDFESIDPNLEKIEIPPVESSDEEQRIREIMEANAQLIPEPRSLVKELKGKMKSLDIYGGTPLENMIASIGARKTLKILRKEKNILGMTSEDWKKQKRNFRRARISVAKSQRKLIKENIEILNESMREVSEDWAYERARHWDEKINNDKGFFNKIDSSLNDFEEKERERIKKRIETIRNSDSPEDLIDTIYKYFTQKPKSEKGSKEKPIFVQKLETLTKPIEEEILPWYERLMILKDMLENLSLDTVLDVVRAIVLLQYYPFIAKYRQYRTTIKKLKNLAIEESLILDAIRTKSQQYGDEAHIIIPPLPSIPDLPDLPDLPI